MEAFFVETYRIPEENLGVLEKRIKKLNRHAKKIGVSPVIMVITNQSEDVMEKGGGVIRFKFVEIHGQSPVIEGWTFLATIQHTTVRRDDTSATNIVRVVPGEEIPDKYRATDPTCDHCKTSRIRKDTYIVRHEDEGFKQVGSSCLKDFLGHADPHGMARYAEFLGIFRSEATGGWCDVDPSIARSYMDTETYLLYVAATIRSFGWVSRTEGRNAQCTATADLALDLMFDRSQIAEPKVSIRKSDTREVEIALEWVRVDLPKKNNLNDYLSNLVVACTETVTEIRSAGIVASLIATYRREREREFEREKEREIGGNSDWVGELDKRIDVTLTVVWLRDFHGYYGVTTMHKFLDGDGNVLVWFASNPFIIPHEESEDGTTAMVQGGTYELRGTVKRHDERDGIKQTILTRITVVRGE